MKTSILPAILPFMALVVITGNYCRMNSSTVSPENENDIRRILHYASLAGSSHNTQPWKAEVFPNDSILVFADPARQLSIVDPKGIELFISVGAFIENLEIAATALGYKTEIRVYETGFNHEKPVARIKLIKTSLPQHIEKLKDLELRTTLRIPFDTATIKNEDRQKLVMTDSANVLFLPANSPEGIFAAKKELEAYTIQAYQKSAQDELAAWIRFSNKDANSTHDGLTPAGMGIKGIGGFVVRNFYGPEDSKKESFVKAGIEKTRNQVENCGGWIIITTENDNQTEWINTGRAYERLNIRCRWLNLGFHPMNQLIEVPEIESEVGNFIPPGQKIRFVARIGYVKDYPAPVSKRRPVESFTIFK